MFAITELQDMEKPISPAILVIDDRPENLLVLRKFLAPLDAEIVTATSGEDGIALLRQRRFALILLDVFMPGMSGQETAEQIRADEELKHVPIILITSHEREDAHRLLWREGVAPVRLQEAPRRRVHGHLLLAC